MIPADRALIDALRQWPEDRLSMRAAARLEELLKAEDARRSREAAAYLERGRAIRDPFVEPSAAATSEGTNSRASTE